MKNIPFFALSSLLVLFLFISCSESEIAQDPSVETNTAENEFIPQDGFYYLERSQVELTGITWEKYQQNSSTKSQAVFGEWVLHPEDRSQVSVIAAGRVKRIYYKLNDQVAKGAPLAELESIDFIHLQRQFIETRSQMALHYLEYNRMKTLLDEDATSLRAFQESESAWIESKSALSSITAQLRLYGVDTTHLATRPPLVSYTITSPITGRIVANQISSGQWLETGAVVCGIANFNAMHADLFLFPNDAGSLKIGDPVTLYTAGSAEEIQGKILHIDQVIDPVRKAIRIHCMPQFPAGMARPAEGSYVSASNKHTPLSGSLYLPQAAVRKEDNGDFIFIYQPAKSTKDHLAFSKMSVNIIQTLPDGFNVDPAVALLGSEEIVMKGAYYIDAQSKVVEFSEE
ncbi:MAG: efflux RND transporter periplasmic adaptor subunit [Saprospiraceae bacterium]|nr:efflux RND transporter periplasmic adaptor subunit [Saprospiraceae bacterium]